MLYIIVNINDTIGLPILNENAFIEKLSLERKEKLLSRK
jgi:hypothetical protein